MSSRTEEGPEYLSDPKVIALRRALRKRDPFCTGICPIPEDQRYLYYTDESDVHRRIDFSNAESDDLDALYHACKPAELGRNGENVFDESYRKAGKMDVSNALLTGDHATMKLELYKLNVYGKGDFFKAHKDTPRGENMFGSLVVVLPTRHEGDKFANAAEPSVCFIAFYGDIEHEVLPITSGHRVTLTYNLYHKPIHPTTSSIPTPFHLSLKQALADLVNDTSKLPDGGYLGFGLVHEYVHTGSNRLGSLEDQLKGSDRALADACKALGVPYSLKLLYRNIGNRRLHLLTTEELHIPDNLDMEASIDQYLEAALNNKTLEQIESIEFFGQHQRPTWQRFYVDTSKFVKDPKSEVMEITQMKSSVEVTKAVMTYGNQAELDYFYGTACMLLVVEPAVSRHAVGL